MRLIRSIGTIVAFGVVVSVFANVNGSSRIAAQGPQGVEAADLFLAMLGDPYLICFVAVPARVLSIAIKVAQSVGSDHLIRHGGRTRSVTYFATDSVVHVVPFLLVWVAVAYALAGRLTSAGLWGLTSYPYSLSVLGEANGSAHHDLVFVASVQVLMLLSACWAIAVTIALVGVWTRGMRTLVWAAAALSLLPLVSFKLDAAIPAPLRPINFMTVDHPGAEGGSVAALGYVGGSLGIGTVMLAGSAVMERRWAWHPRCPLRRFVAYGIVAAACTLWSDIYWNRAGLAGADLLTAVFYGAAGDGFRLVPVFLNLVVTGGAAVVLSAGFVERLGAGIYQELIRSRSIGQWFLSQFMRSWLVASFVLAVGTLSIHLAYALAVGDSLQPRTRLVHLGVYMILATTVQILVYCVAFALATVVTGRTVAALWVMGGIVVSTIPEVFRLGFVPGARNSSSTLANGGAGWGSLAVLGVWLGVGLLVLAFVLRVRGVRSS